MRPGDWLYQIATDHGVSVGDIVRLNPAITVPDLLITPGQVIMLVESPVPDPVAATSLSARQDAEIFGASPGVDEIGANGAPTETASVSRTQPTTAPADAPGPVGVPAPGAAALGGPAESGDDTLHFALAAFALGLLLGVGGTWALARRHRYARLG